MTILQVCNVGRIVGGTAACAWSIARAFPDATHHVAFLSKITDDTRAAFAGATLHRCDRITDRFACDTHADFVILHNTAPHRCERLSSAWTMQYVHSQGLKADADLTVYCSRWLARQCGAGDAEVLLQCVPRPCGSDRARPGGSLLVGRICTPTDLKWPVTLIEFYRQLCLRHPHVAWEFVGCPSRLCPALELACGGRATFHRAGWKARKHLARWDVLLYHHPTLTESFGRTVAEAMRAGCVPIVDRRGGFCEQVAGGSGFLCESVEDFSAALEEVTCPTHRQTISRAARQHAEDLFSMSAFRNRLLAVLRSSGALGRPG